MQHTGRLLALAAACAGGFLAARAVVSTLRRFDLEGRVALITGGSRGLGLNIARELLAAGCRVAICARNPEELEAARRALAPDGPVHAWACDITDRDQVRMMVRGVERTLGPIAVLVNNAGIISVGPEREMTLDDYDAAMRVHFWGHVYTTMEVLESMRRRGEGRIANISSIGGKVPVPHLAPYCASKFALSGFSGSLRAELMHEGIYITTVLPGLMRTGSHRNALFKGRHHAEYAFFKGSLALPGGSVSARHAARRIVRAIRHGEGEVIIGLPALLAARMHDLMPETVSDLLGLVAGALPGPGGIGRAYATGAESESRFTALPGIRRVDKAIAPNNEG